MITNTLKSTDIHINYTGSNLSEKEAIEKGFTQLSGEELLSRITNKTIRGDYPNGYTFVTRLSMNGEAEGINNVGSYDVGHWVIDFVKNTLTLIWKNGWFDTITRAYEINGNIEFYDIDTGNWRTTFKEFENLEMD